MHYACRLDPAPGHRPEQENQGLRLRNPARIDGQKGAIHGTLYWVGAANPSKAPFLIGGIAIADRGRLGWSCVLRRRQAMDDGARSEPARSRRRRPGSATSAPAPWRRRCWRRWRVPATRARARPARGHESPSAAPWSSTSRPAVIFRFDEPVEGNFGAVRVYDADGAARRRRRRLPPERRRPTPRRPPQARPPGRQLHRHLPGDLRRRPHRLQRLRLLDRQGGQGAERDGRGTDRRLGQRARSPRPPSASPAGCSTRRSRSGSAALAFLLLAWLPALAAVGGEGEAWSRAARGFGARLRTTLSASPPGIGALSAAAGVVLEGAEAAGVSGFSALKWTIVRETLETKFGTIWGLAVLAWLAFGVLAAPVSAPPGRASA